MEELNLTRSTVETHQLREIAPSDPTEAALVGLLADEPVHIDHLCRASGLTITEVSSALAIMELKGWCAAWKA